MNQHTVNCEFCSSQETKVRIDFGEVKIYSCANCDVSFTYPQPRESDLDEVYDENYFSNKDFASGDLNSTYGYFDYESSKKINEDEHSRICERIASTFNGDVQGKRLLDIGCGMGGFMAAAAKHGFDVEGVEFNDYAANSIRSEFGYVVHGRNDFDALIRSERRFEFIVMFDVIEHLLEPIKLIRDVHALLADDGLLLVGTTDFDHPIPKLLGGKFEDFRRVREHIFFFGKKGLISTLEMNGFRHLCTDPQRIMERAENLSARLKGAGVPGASAMQKLVEISHLGAVNVPINFGMKFVSYFGKNHQCEESVSETKALKLPITLSVIIPVFNEARTIRHVINKVLEVEIEGVAVELIVVDDGSRDNSRSILSGLSEELGFKLNMKARNQGKGSALQVGIAEATGDIVIIQDADLEYNPQDYPRLIAPILAGDADAVYGSRFLSPERRVMKFWHTYGNKMLTFICNMVVNLNITDMETCYKAMKMDVAKSLSLKSRRFDVEPEITCKLALAGKRIYEVPIRYHARSYEEGKKIGIRDLFEALVAILKFGVLRFS